MSALRSRPARAAAVSALAVGIGALTLLPGGSPPAVAQALVPWSDCGALLEHYRSELARTATPYGVGGPAGGFALDGRMEAGGTALAAAAPTAESARTGTADAVGSGPTGTNLQEAGVDEPDTAKLSGGLLVSVAAGRLQVVRAGPEPELLSSVPLPGGGGGELLVDGTRVLVVSSGWQTSPADARLSMVAPAGRGVVELALVDLADPRAPQLLERVRLDGRYVSARLSGGTVRLVTTSSPLVTASSPAEPYGPAQEQEALLRNQAAARAVEADDVLPRVVRVAPDGTETAAPAVECTDVARAGSPVGVGTLLVTTLRLSAGLGALDSTAVTTDGDLVYASADRLYVATSRWGTVAPAADVVEAGTPTTELHAFDTTSPDRTRYVGSGSVPGYLYGRWALSGYLGDLRVATTLQAPWDAVEQASSSLVVLREDGSRLVERGRVDGLGPGERIYAVRFFGDVATVVTFRQTDPLYVLDLSDPAAPRIAGELKVPGFSTYLHPVGDGRLLAVGQDADPATGRVTGFQLSTYDISDLTRPTQLDRLSLGRAWSPASDDSRAFSYDPERRVAVLPLSTERGGSALAVRVEGDGRLAEAGRLGLGPDLAERVLVDDGGAYAVTWSGVVAASLPALGRTGGVGFAGAVPGPPVGD